MRQLIIIAATCALASCNAHFYHVRAPSTLTVRDNKDSIVMHEQVQGRFVVNTKYLQKGYSIRISTDTMQTVNNHKSHADETKN
jgi:hypothetical protein